MKYIIVDNSTKEVIQRFKWCGECMREYRKLIKEGRNVSWFNTSHPVATPIEYKG